MGATPLFTNNTHPAKSEDRGPDGKFLPGNLANPGGRVKKRPISDRNSAVCEVKVPEKTIKALNRTWGNLGIEIPLGSTWGDVIVLAGVLEAIKTKNGTLARKEIRESIEGKSTQRVELIGGSEQRRTEVIVNFKAGGVGNPRALETEQNSVQIGIRETEQITQSIVVNGALTDEETPDTSENGSK